MYFALSQDLIGSRNCQRAAHRERMPYLLSFPEHDGTRHLHHHGILYVPSGPEATRMQAKVGDNTLCALHPLVRTSCVKRCTKLDGWLDYMTKSNAAIDRPLWCGPKLNSAVH